MKAINVLLWFAMVGGTFATIYLISRWSVNKEMEMWDEYIEEELKTLKNLR